MPCKHFRKAEKIQSDKKIVPRRATDGSRHQRAPTLPVAALRDVEDEIRPVARQFAGEQSFPLDATDLGHRALRAPVFLADPEHHGVDESEGMIEHQPLDLAVGGAAPMAADDKSPADLDLAAFGLIAIIAARADQAPARPIDEHKTHFGIE